MVRYTTLAALLIAVALMLLSITGCSDRVHDMHDFWDNQESRVKPGGV